LLPVLAQAVQHPAKAYLFVDAGLPHPGQSQLDEMKASVPAFAQELRKSLTSGERFPRWSDEDLREDIPDGRTHQQMLAQLQPRPLNFLRKSCQMFPDGLMLLVAISCLARDIATFWSKLREQDGRDERFMPGIFTCWLILSPWLWPLLNS
jgi:hypothetical protein